MLPLPPTSAGGCPPALRDDSRGGCWAFPTHPPPHFREDHPGWNRNGPVTCWGREHAGDRQPCPPTQPQAPLHTVPSGDNGCPGVSSPTMLQGWGRSRPRAIGVVVPRGSCCCRCLLLLPRVTPFNKSISIVWLLAHVAAGRTQDVTPPPPQSQWEGGAPALPLQHSPSGVGQE